MPDLSQIPVPNYTGSQPYHYSYDNIPIQVLAERDEIINNSVDEHTQVLINSAGTSGNLTLRLAQSLYANGSLIEASVDSTLHNIAYHTDGNITVSSGELSNYVALGFPSLTNPVEFVRMLEAERSKLSSVADNSTDITVAFETNANTTVTYVNPFTVKQSSSIQWEVVGINEVQAVVAQNNPHLHFYGVNPLSTLVGSTTVYSIPNPPFMSSSLRVYVNGSRMLENQTIPYPRNIAGDISWVSNGYTVDYGNLTFSFSSELTVNDIVVVDYEKQMT